MASYGFHVGIQKAMEGTLNFESGAWYVMLVMSNFSGATAGVGDKTLVQTTAGVQARDVANMSEIETLDQCDASSGYTTKGTALAGMAVTLDTTNHLVKFDATDPAVWTGLDGSTRDVVGAIVYFYGGVTANGDGATDFPVAFLDSANFNDNSSDVTLTFSANGILTVQF